MAKLLIDPKILTGFFRVNFYRSLVGKSKFFIIQICGGSELDSGIQTNSDSEEDMASQEILVEVDFLYAYSTRPG